MTMKRMTLVPEVPGHLSPCFYRDTAMGTATKLDTKSKTAPVQPPEPIVFMVAKAVASIEQLRTEASDYSVQYETGGRNALNKLMAAVYKHYHDAVSSGKVDQLATQLRSRLKAIDPELEPSKNAHMSNILVRYVFKDPDAKQVSVYARCLRVLANRSPAVLPKDFVAAVNAQKGGYSGFTEPKSGKAPKAQVTPETALSEVENLPTVETVSFDWNDGEDFRVLVAVRSDSDDQAELKAVPVSEKLRDALLVGYLKERQAAAKAPKASVTADQELAVLSAESRALEAKVAVATAKKALEVAKVDKPKGDHKKLTDAIDAAKATMAIAREELKIAKKK